MCRKPIFKQAMTGYERLKRHRKKKPVERLRRELKAYRDPAAKRPTPKRASLDFWPTPPDVAAVLVDHVLPIFGDIQALVNVGRSATINSARITEVKEDQAQKTATDEEVEFFQIKKRSFDSRTGLNLFDDERLIRAREAMILAVQIFNSAALSFKTEVFSVLANIAWTYLLHEHYSRKGIRIVQND